ncbi:hypothetical protein KBB96_03890 [Luteolibacter ambystomatis]|uniref:Uncharacterized protein n=1 Tax=Luteolibacter ambystomatis TaxID=2824561 RepID=A0A975J124_9BACT|nr:hypothetical protein [Luteolibacter ambystomatis]QUE52034.1 hypothetical protein KBB96_03890 [Luteolibacter ambystomatis]
MEKSSSQIRTILHAKRILDIYVHAVETAHVEPDYSKSNTPRVLVGRTFYFAFSDNLQFAQSGSSEARYYVRLSTTTDGKIYGRSFYRTNTLRP